MLPKDESHPGMEMAGKLPEYLTAIPYATATSKPPIDEQACV
jgi:hypothetical protein